MFLAFQIKKHSPNIPSEASLAIKNIDSPPFLINFICSNMNAEVEDKQKMLEKVMKISFFVFETNYKRFSVQYCQLIPRKLAPCFAPVFQVTIVRVAAS